MGTVSSDDVDGATGGVPVGVLAGLVTSVEHGVPDDTPHAGSA